MVLVPAWTRRWDQAALVAAWFAVNPVLFGRPADDRAWATRAMLGEELWIRRLPRDGAMVVSVAAGAAQATAIVAAWRHHGRVAAVATAVQMGLTLVYWRQMAGYLAAASGGRFR
ncbi:hypothetical protein QGN32_00330 [Mycolicibacterium sp. ND9-15]|uniref:hypothetical protein n=1 Tax=Mycolicibacterium sp. ND9-15 TaxID=3042320 RepID=UPI002DDA3139|nr:hypothetical protein [Mycolicibacterium sp. ND9-15]WSE58600.1 hypothetical protein QGN32_00330 [Mycolicibacterium sp. ND9-15]